MKRISFGLLIAITVVLGLAGCTTTSNNANLRNANTNTGYLTNSNNAAPISNSNSRNANTNSGYVTNSNSAAPIGNSNSNTHTNR